jgi:hypothetical protein
METTRRPRTTEGGIGLHMYTMVCHSTIAGQNIKFAMCEVLLLVNMLVISLKNSTFKL